MSSDELIIEIRRGKHTITAFPSPLEPFLGRLCLAGPLAIEDLLTSDAGGASDGTSGPVLVMDRDHRRALCNSRVLFSADDDEDHEESAQAVAIGVWACFGWTLRFWEHIGLQQETLGHWPDRRAPTAPTDALLAHVWRSLGSWHPLRPDIPNAANVAPLQGHGLGVDTSGLYPRLVGLGGEAATLRQQLFAFGAAAAKGTLQLPGFSLASSSEEEDGPLQWGSALVDPESFIATLANRSGETKEEIRLNLEDAVEAELKRRGWLKVSPLAVLGALDGEQQETVLAEVRRLFEDAGLC